MTESTRKDTITVTEQANAPAPASTAEDAELLQLCAEFHANQDRLFALLKIMDAEDGNEAHKANEKWNELLDQIGEMQAQTLPGLIAKAKISVMLIRGWKGDPEKEWMDHDDFLPLSLAEDLVAFGHSQTAV